MTVRTPIVRPGMRVGLLGGSFDPAHEGHAHITEFALRRFGLDRVWWLVSPGNPLKEHGPARMDERLAAARQVMRHPRVEITDIEARLGTRMTADTIAGLQRLCPAVQFVWLMGSDNLVQFDQWDRWSEIAARVPIGVLARPGSRLAARQSRAAQIMRAARLPEAYARLLPMMKPPAWVLLNLPMSPLSSTMIRQGRNGRTDKEGMAR
ncbi:nicotinate-nucleotide adenylyltransferase [Paracoccus methylarcula]|uniref:Probable nicotinate-nucleotide adenylyltransferase n=1 Tax=Paracoccus methylarcula TaxID=72022 RepID=A0A3R7LIR4_9RHOB|nr:nicotinate-nucleotide adenylyltransferase [Paracoccus methylarcula]RNF33381.1 nicotinate-nucleotide adenylyltransferase [Paracoccus methylarcula]